MNSGNESKTTGSSRPITLRTETWQRLFLTKISIEKELKNTIEWSSFEELLLDVYEGIPREEAVKKRTEKK